MDAGWLAGFGSGALTTCCLGWAQLGPRELLALSMNTAKLSSLTTLCMPRNAVDDKGLIALVAGLKTAAVIKNLDLSGNKITHRGVQELAHELLRSNRCAEPLGFLPRGAWREGHNRSVPEHPPDPNYLSSEKATNSDLN
jgi:hypothetical protein